MHGRDTLPVGGTRVPQFDDCRRLGVRVYDVPGLHRELIWIPEDYSAFVKAGLSPARRERVSRTLLSMALAERVSLDST